MMRRGAYVLTLLGTVSLSALPVQAFSDPASFGLAPLAAGGGGRYFTGSPADGYTCKVCHSGGAEPKLSVLGLPLSGYRPSARYEVSVTWPAEVEKFAAALELTDSQGAVAGTLQLPPDDEIQLVEFCEPASDAVPAASLIETSTGRQVINLPDCGAKRIRMLWTAPSRDIGQVWFAGSSVWSDGESDPDHDGVTDFGRVLASPSQASTSTSTTTSCSAVAGIGQLQHAQSQLTVWLGTWFWLGAGLYIRRRRSWVKARGMRR